MTSETSQNSVPNFEATQRDEETLAFLSLKRAADSGDAEAALCVAKMCLCGLGCAADYEQCIKYVRRAAGHDQPEAMAMYALLILQDSSYSGKAKNAISLLKKAAKMNSPHAYVVLGYLYNNGVGVPKDINKGSEYLCLAAGMGIDVAESLLLYGSNRCGLPNDETARQKVLAYLRTSNNELFKKIAVILSSSGDPVAQIMASSKLLATRVPDAHVSQYVQSAVALVEGCPSAEIAAHIGHIEKAIQNNVVGAATFLASLYLEGRIVPADPSKAAQLLHRDADSGFQQAQYTLSKMYDVGAGVEHDPNKAFSYCQQAASQGNVDAYFALGQMYRLGHNVAPDLIKALEYLRLASDENHPAAMYVLAFMYFRGDGVAVDVKRCVALLKRAADLGNLDAMVSLAEFYSGDLGVPAQPQRALELLLRAASAGNARAQALLHESD